SSPSARTCRPGCGQRCSSRRTACGGRPPSSTDGNDEGSAAEVAAGRPPAWPACVRIADTRSSATGPDHALILRRRPISPEDELLQALPFPGLRRIDVAPGVRGDAVHAVELARLAA